MRVLALDIATATGFAYRCEHEGLTVGTWKLASPKEVKEWTSTRLTRRCDPRIKRLFDLVSALHERFAFDVVCIEDVCFASSVYQVQLWSSLRAAVWLACGWRVKAPYFEAVPVGTLKKFATGCGNADKAQMLAAAKRKRLLDNPADLDEATDDAIDALWLHNWAEANLARMFKI